MRKVDPDRHVACLLILKACRDRVRQSSVRTCVNEQLRDVLTAGTDEGAPGVSREALCAHCLLILRGRAVHGGGITVEGNAGVAQSSVNFKAAPGAEVRGPLRCGVAGRPGGGVRTADKLIKADVEVIVRHFCEGCKGA